MTEFDASPGAAFRELEKTDRSSDVLGSVKKNRWGEEKGPGHSVRAGGVKEPLSNSKGVSLCWKQLSTTVVGGGEGVYNQKGGEEKINTNRRSLLACET